MSSETRRAYKTRRDDDDDASSRLEARIPFSLPWLQFLREDVDVFVVAIVERRARRKDARQHDTREAISIQFPERERRCTKRVRALKDAHIRARRRRGICKDNRRLNPIHVSKKNNNIVHGALLVSMFPALVGTTFPGAKYLRQTAKFRNECPVGARVTATVRKVKETRGGKIVEFETKVRCAEDEGKVYVDGFALAKIE